MTEIAYELRELTAEDIFPMFNIISKIGLKEFKECFASEGVQTAVKAAIGKGEVKEKDISSIGMAVAFDILDIIIRNISKCKDDLYIFLSGLSGIPKADISKLPLKVFTGMIIDVVKKEEFTDFFQAVAKLLN